MKIKEIIAALERFAPLPLQDGFDNAGLQTGLTEVHATGALLCLDLTEDVVDEAIDAGFNLIVAHHPVLFHGVKSLTGKNYVERCLMKAIRNDIAIYAAHTNLDNTCGGVNYKMAEKIGLKEVRFLQPLESGQQGGAGVIGVLDHREDAMTFLRRLKTAFGAECLKHSRLSGQDVQTVALCGGAGAFLIPRAIQEGADVFVTGEIKYHEFFGHDKDILLVALGHYESEQYTTEIFETIIREVAPALTVRRTQVNTNPIQYL